MALVYQKLTLEVTPGMIPPVLHVTEYDINMQIDVTFTQRGQPFEVPSGTTAKVEGTLAGHPFRKNCTVNGNTVTFILSENMTAYAGRAWTKIVLTKDSWPVSTCGFWLDCDRAGVEAGTIIGAPGFEEQIADAVEDYLDDHQPFFTLPEGGQSGQALLSDGNNGAYWGTIQSGGSGLTDAIKTALMNVVNHIGAWSDAHGAEYAQALHDALYPPAPAANLVSITASFNPGSHVVYDTDTLDSLKPYLTVTAQYDNSTTQTVTGYTLSGTLTAGTRTITVSYTSGTITKTTTFNVTVVHAETGEVEMMSIVSNFSANPAAHFSDGGETAYSDERFPTSTACAVRSVRVFDSDTRLKITCAPSTSVFQCFLFTSSLWGGSAPFNSETELYYCEPSKNTFAYSWSDETHVFEYTVKAGYAFVIESILAGQGAVEAITVEVI